MTNMTTISIVAKAIMNGDINSRRRVAIENDISERTIIRCINELIFDKMIFRVGVGRGSKLYFTNVFRMRVKRGYYDG